ncbi:MAG TPA: DNA methyltransferase [Chloroflexota bacterium]|nr:DNA methyltransferase [Chloroflexota bacterium]HUM68235.1 DNA methyltransferase [Chloroflexota bacterium]
MSDMEKSKLVKLNYSSCSELMALEGVGRKRAIAIVEHRENFGPFLSVEDLENVPHMNASLVNKIKKHLDWSFNGYFISEPRYMMADARLLHQLLDTKVDLVITSPPYWQKRDYKHPEQLGQENSPEEYVQELSSTISSWIPLLHFHASVFINVGDTYRDGRLLSIPAMLEMALQKSGWLLVNKIIWSKSNGVPEPLPFRLANRHEVIFQLTRNSNYFSDVNALAQYLGQNANPGDVWQIPHARKETNHLAPFPDELVKRIVHFASPEHVCKTCQKPFTRNIEPTFELDMTRPQAHRAIELFKQAGLSDAHLKAIRAVGISDAGKGQRVQGSNAEITKQLADEAKKALGGYFREFTFSQRVQVGWNKCNCPLSTRPGIVLDPFMGSKTTTRLANQLGRIAIGSDLILGDNR